MLETDEVDDDYFTPVSSTSLANIFGNSSQNDKGKVNSLKYTPPKKHVPHALDSTFEDNSKTECIFACVLTAYEWVDNNYADKGIVGFAIVKNHKNDNHSIVLYNSKKITFSSTPVTKTMTIVVKGNHYICFYDILSKYWSLYAKEEDVKEVAQILNILGVNVKYELTDQNLLQSDEKKNDKIKTPSESDKESDTDSSTNRRTKAAILNRMATVGQSVLPPQNLPVDKQSDSSGTNDTVNQITKVTRHKPVKATAKRIYTDKNIADKLDYSETNTALTKIEQPLISQAVYTIINGQLVPISNTNILSGGNYNSNEMSMFMNEQRMNNNELRININRTTDKVDQILDKIKTLEGSDICKNYSISPLETMQKLLTEYEKKIKCYEQILANQKTDDDSAQSSIYPITMSTETARYKQQISELQDAIAQKEKTICRLTEILDDNKLTKEITDLKALLALKNEECENVLKKIEESKNENCENKKGGSDKLFEDILKRTMNDVFQSIALNFENGASYSGENVKKTIANIIKKVTIQYLNECGSEN